MTGLGQDHRDRLPLVSKPRAQTSPSPACGGTSELSCHGSQPLRLEKSSPQSQCSATWLSLVWWLWWLLFLTRTEQSQDVVVVVVVKEGVVKVVVVVVVDKLVKVVVVVLVRT